MVVGDDGDGRWLRESGILILLMGLGILATSLLAGTGDDDSRCLPTALLHSGAVLSMVTGILLLFLADAEGHIPGWVSSVSRKSSILLVLVASAGMVAVPGNPFPALMFLSSIIALFLLSRNNATRRR